MEEFSLFGITINTSVNIFVAVGTILMAYFTYISVKTSQKQFQIFQREKEKPQAFDQIQNVFNVIQEDLNLEIYAINHTSITFALNEDPNTNEVGPLIFPISAKKRFYRPFRISFSGESVLADKHVLSLIDVIENNLNQRYDIYQELSHKMRSLETELDHQFIQPNYPELLSKGPGLRVQTQSTETGSTYQIYRGDRKVEPFFESWMKRSIQNIFIVKIFKPQENPANHVISYISNLFLEDLNTYIQTLLENNHETKIYEIQQRIVQDLHALKNTDEQILKQIQEMKIIYRDMFLLTATELDSPANTW